MPCEHLGPIDLMELAETFLLHRNIPESDWPGKVFGYGENLGEGMWASVWTEIERRGAEWIVTRIDRSPEALPDSRLGLFDVTLARGDGR
jgi:hypothetical protein